MNLQKLTIKQKIKYGSYYFILSPLDERCNSLKIQIHEDSNNYEETINIYDFIDIKEVLKSGKKMKEINQLSLLFLKLIISTSIANKTIKISKIKDMPFEKIIKKKQKLQQKWVQTDPTKEAKGLLLQLKQNLWIIIPKLLITPPKTLQKANPKTQKQHKIKQLFFSQQQKQKSLII